MDAAQMRREAERQKLLLRLAELTVEEMVEQGTFLETPHYSIIERKAIALGRRLSQQTQQRAAREVAARHEAEAACPSCQSACRVETRARQLSSLDGPVELTETAAYCDRCRRSFFPSADQAGPGQP